MAKYDLDEMKSTIGTHNSQIEQHKEYIVTLSKYIQINGDVRHPVIKETGWLWWRHIYRNCPECRGVLKCEMIDIITRYNYYQCTDCDYEYAKFMGYNSRID